MNEKEYIATGKLELYVLGKLDPQEEREVERMAAEHPAIQQELESIELALERYAQLHSVPPPAGVLDNVLDRIRSARPNTPGTPAPPRTGSAGSGRSLTPLWAVLFAVVAMAAGWFWYQNNLSQTENAELENQLVTLTEDCAEQAQVMNLMAEQIDFLRSPASRQIILNSANEELAPNALASVFYNPEVRRSYFTPANLPTAPTGRQYQLWAIVDGAPVDMGVLTFDGGSTDLIEVPFIENPGAFAITLEPEGGSEAPTLDQLYVIGNVS